MRQLKITRSITNREEDSLNRYLHEIAMEPMISINEEVELAQRIRTGDQDAIDKLIRANLRFVISVAKQYQNQGLGLSDLVNEGNLGMIRAAKKFDETKGFKFISYAVWWIRQSILKALAEQSRIVRLPLNQVGSINRIHRAYSNFEQKYERAPSRQELANDLDLPIERIEGILNYTGRNLSFDAPLSSVEGDNETLLDIFINKNSLSPDKGLAVRESLSFEIDRSLSTISEKEAEIVRMFFGLSGNREMTIEEIGEELGLTYERIRQIKDKALRRLRSPGRQKILKSYLG